MNILVRIIIGVLFLFTNVFSQESNIDKQVVVMFSSNVILLPEGLSNAALEKTEMPKNIRNILIGAGTLEIKKGWPDFKSTDTLKILTDGRKLTFPDYTNFFVITLKSEKDRDILIQRLSTIPEVIAVDKNVMMSIESDPNDTHFNLQWGLNNTGQGGGTPGADINILPAWVITTGNSSIKIGIIDLPIVATHTDFDGRVNYGGFGFQSDDHGMHVTGIAAATGNNRKGIAGINWTSPVYCDVLDDLPTTIQAINRAIAEGCRIINCSWTEPNGSGNLYNTMLNGYYNGILFVIAGMQSSSASEKPKKFGPWILNVASLKNTGERSRFGYSRYYHDVAAPGGDNWGDIRDIYSTSFNDSYVYKAGTSMAAPHVTGVASLLLSVNPNLKNYDLEEILKRTAKNYPNFDGYTGYGCIDAYKALMRLRAPNTVLKGSATLTKQLNDAKYAFVEPPLYDLPTGYYKIDRYELSANVNFSFMKDIMAWLPRGYSGANPNDGKEFLFESKTSTNVQLKTFFYFIEGYWGGGNIQRWAPFNPNTFLEYTIIGQPISFPSISTIIQSPSTIYRGQNGYLTCNATGDELTYTWTVQSKPDYIVLGDLNGSTLTVSNIPMLANKSGNGNVIMKPPVDLIVTCTVTNPAGSVARICTASVFASDPPPPPGGGCPFLFVNTDNGYVMENNMLHRSEFEGNAGKDIKDVYKLNVQPVADKNKLYFKILELNRDHSYFDRIKLYTVDHPAGSEIGVTENNDIVVYLPTGVVSSSNALLNDKNVTDLIQYNLKSPGVEGVSNDRLFMNFNAKSFDFKNILKSLNAEGAADSVAVIMNTEGVVVTPVDPPKEMAGTVGGNEAAEKTFQRGFARREKQSVVIVPLSGLVTLDSLNIDWRRDYDLQYAAITPILYGGYEKKELNLIAADHSVNGNIKQQLKSVDKVYAELDTNGFITLTFNTGGNVKSGWVRDYVIETDGYYLRPGTGENKGIAGKSIQKELLSGSALPTKFELNANYPNPFNPSTTIEYAVPHQGLVTIKVYDVLGREVATLVNDNHAQGRYKVSWNASGLSSGIYIYRMTAKDYKSVRKMLLIK